MQHQNQRPFSNNNMKRRFFGANTASGAPPSKSFDTGAANPQFLASGIGSSTSARVRPIIPTKAPINNASLNMLHHPNPRLKKINYEALAKKNLSSYRQQIAKESLKQRNKTYICLADNFSSSKEQGTLPSLETSTVALGESDLEAIRNYERAKFGAQSSAERIPAAVGSVKFEAWSQKRQSPVQHIERPKQSSSTLVGQPQLRKETVNVKQEPAEEPTNEIETIRSAPCSSATQVRSTASPMSGNEHAKVICKTEEAFKLDDETKKKQALLWSICQEELTVKSNLERCEKRRTELKRALETEDTTFDELTVKLGNIDERKRMLLQSVDELTVDEGI